jgi:hypothetical protein
MNPLFAASIYWDMPILLVVVSLVYSAARHDRWDRIWREALRWLGQIVGFLGGLAAILYIASTYF